jgi:Transposase DDE domain group 1
VFGLARNNRLVAKLGRELKGAQSEASRTGRAARRFKDFQWTTLDSWHRKRRVSGKAEWTRGEANPRFIVTSFDRSEIEGQALYEEVYCARGDMENRIRECQTDLFADRTPTATMRANQLGLWFASFADVLVCALRRLALAGTELAKATCGSIRLKLLKIGAQVTLSVRRVKIAFASSYPLQELFALAHERLTRLPPQARLRPVAA